MAQPDARPSWNMGARRRSVSNNDPQVLAYHLTRQGGERLRQLVAGAPKANLLGLESAVEEFERKALQLQPEVLLVEFDPDEKGISELLGRLRRGGPAGSHGGLGQQSKFRGDSLGHAPRGCGNTCPARPTKPPLPRPCNVCWPPPRRATSKEPCWG